MPSNLEKWMASLTPEQREAHKQKMAEGRRRASRAKRAEAKSLPAIEATPVPASFTPDAPEYQATFRALLREYLERTAGQTGNGDATDKWCRLCIASGIHYDVLVCDCPCHRTRTALAAYDDARSAVQNLR